MNSWVKYRKFYGILRDSDHEFYGFIRLLNYQSVLQYTLSCKKGSVPDLSRVHHGLDRHVLYQIWPSRVLPSHESTACWRQSPNDRILKVVFPAWSIDDNRWSDILGNPGLQRGGGLSNIRTPPQKKQSIFQYYFLPICSLNDLRQTYNSRVYSLCIGLVLLS